MTNNKEEIKNVINETLKNFACLSDANSVVGSPITADNGVTIVPVSKMTVGFLSGGGEYGEIKIFGGNKNYPLTSGSGGIVTVKPSGFIVVENSGVKFISCPEDYIEKGMDELFKMIGKLYGEN